MTLWVENYPYSSPFKVLMRFMMSIGPFIPMSFHIYVRGDGNGNCWRYDIFKVHIHLYDEVCTRTCMH